MASVRLAFRGFLLLAVASLASPLVLAAPVAASATPDAPVLTFTSATASAIRVSWTAPASNGSPITRFELRRGETLVSSTITAATLTFNNTGLAAGTGYSFTLKACNTFGCSAASTALTAATIPVAATALVGTPGNMQVSLAWTNSVSPAVTGYKVSYRLSTVSTWTEWTPDVDDTSPTVVTGLSNASVYVFKVTAYNASGVIDSRVSSNVTPRTVPSAPTIAATSIGATGVTFAWSAPASNGAAVSSFKVFRGDTLVATLSGTASKATVSTLTAGTEYSFKVQACNVAGCSTDSNTLTVPTLPASTALITPTPGDGQISVAWTSSVSPVVSGYQLQYKTSAAALWSDWTPGVDDTSPSVVTGLVNGTGYVFRVVTVNASGSVVSASTTASIPRTLPGTPVLASPVVTASSIALTWTAPASGGMPITSYQVYVNNTINQTVTSAKATLSGLTSATVYAVKVRACTVAGCGPFTSTLSQVTKALPVTVSSVKADSQVTLTWSNATGTIDAHKVFFKVATVSSWTEWTPGVSDSSPTVVTGLVNGVTYNFMVAAVNDAASVESRSISVSLVGVPPTAPAQPTSSTVTAVGATVTWVAPSNTGGVSATGYQVWVNGLLAATTNSSARSYTVTGQSSGETHTVQIKVCNTYGCSPASTARSFTTLPVAATGLAVTPSTLTVSVSWTASTGSAVTAHNLYYKTASSATWTEWTPGVADTSPVTVTGLTASTAYSFKVQTVASSGNVETSTVNATTTAAVATPPGTPTNVQATAGNEEITVDWTAPIDDGGSSITGYQIEYRTAAASDVVNGQDIIYNWPDIYPTVSNVSFNSATQTLTFTANWDCYYSKPGGGVAGFGGLNIWDETSGISPVAWMSSDLYMEAGALEWTGATTGLVIATRSAAPAEASGNFPPNGGAGDPSCTYTINYTNLAIERGHDPYTAARISQMHIAPTHGSLSPNALRFNLAAAGSWETVSSATTSRTLTGLTAQTSYEIRVSAVNAAGTGTASTTAAATPYTTPGTPSGVSTSAALNQVTLNWTAPSNNGGSAITGYLVEYHDGDSNWTAHSTTSSLSATLTGLSAPTVYSFRVSAVNTAGYSPVTSTVTATPLALPGAPTGVTATAGNGQIAVSWTAPASNGGSTITGYTATATPGGATCASSFNMMTFQTGTSCTITGLTNGTEYTITVTATSSAGTGTASTPTSATPAAPITLSYNNTRFSPSIASQVLSPTTTQSPTSFSVSGSLPAGVTFDTSTGAFTGPSAWPGAAKVAYGYDHACAITLTGGVNCWGKNSHGQLGNGTTTNSSTPVQVTGLTSGVTDITAGYNHTCAIQSGVAKCWGQNNNGQLGDGTSVTRTTPVTVGTIGSDVLDIETTRWQSATCAIVGTVAANHVWCWGWSQHMDVSGSTPSIKAGIWDVSRLALGEHHACAITNSRELYCWGYNGDGQLGDGTTTGSVQPIAVLGGSGVTDLSIGQGHTCAVQNGTLYCWGFNYGGQLGNGVSVWTANPTPIIPTGMSYDSVTGVAVSAVYTGQSSTCAVRSDEKVFCWGELVPGTGSDFSTGSFPTEIPALQGKVFQMSGGHYNMCAVLRSGDLNCWGFNNVGQLGNGSTSYATTPVTVSGFDADADFPVTVTVTASNASTSTSVDVTLTTNRFAAQTTGWSFTGHSVSSCCQGFFYTNDNAAASAAGTSGWEISLDGENWIPMGVYALPTDKSDGSLAWNNPNALSSWDGKQWFQVRTPTGLVSNVVRR